MKISVLSLLFCRYPLYKAFEAISRIGYDGIDLYGARPHAYPFDMDATRISEVLHLKEKHKLEIPMYTPELLAYPYNIASQSKKEREDTLEYLIRGIDVAGSLEIPRMQITCGHAGNNTFRDQNYKNIYEVLGPLLEKAEKTGVRIVIEPLTVMESNTIVFIDDLVEVLEHFNSPNLNGMLDTVTPIVNREPFAEHFEKLGSKLDYIHFVDSNGTDESHMLLGQGIINLPGLVDTIREYGYDDWLCVEIINRYISEPETYAKRELMKLKKLIELE